MELMTGRRRTPLSVCLITCLLASLLVTPSVSAGTCGGVLLINQAQVDSFSCTEVNGDLRIRSSEITNLDGLAGLTTVTGTLSISETSLTNVDGLASVSGAVGGLTIEGNPLLENVDGLAGITASNSLLFVVGNDSLQDVEGLAQVGFVASLALIVGNPMLTNCCGLYPLAQINPNVFAVADNGGGCQSFFEIIENGPCGSPISVESETWGRIKGHYR